MAGQPFELDRERAIRQILGQPEPGPFPVTLVWRDMGLILRRARVTVQNPYATIMDLRALIEEEFAIPPGDQRLFRSSGGPLSDGDAAADAGDCIYVEEALDDAPPAPAPPPAPPPPAPARRAAPPPPAPPQGDDALSRLDALAAAEHAGNVARMQKAGIAPRGPTIVDGGGRALDFENFTSPTGGGQIFQAPAPAPPAAAPPRVAATPAARPAPAPAAPERADAAESAEDAASRKKILALVVDKDGADRRECLVARLPNGTTLTLHVGGAAPATVGDLRRYAGRDGPVDVVERSSLPPRRLDDDAEPLRPGTVVAQRGDGARRPPPALGQDGPAERLEIDVGDGTKVAGEFRGIYKTSDGSFERAGMALLVLGPDTPEGKGDELARAVALPTFRFAATEEKGEDALAAVFAHFQRQSPFLVFRALLGYGGGAAAALAYAATSDPRRVPPLVALLAPLTYLPRLPIGRIEARVLVVHKASDASKRNARRFKQRHPAPELITLKQADFKSPAAVGAIVSDVILGARRFE